MFFHTSPVSISVTDVHLQNSDREQMCFGQYWEKTLRGATSLGMIQFDSPCKEYIFTAPGMIIFKR